MSFLQIWMVCQLHDVRNRGHPEHPGICATTGGCHGARGNLRGRRMQQRSKPVPLNLGQLQ